jgi:hypothetical protein
MNAIARVAAQLAGVRTTYRISGYKSLWEHKQLNLLCGGLLDELYSLLDGSSFVHVNRRCMSCCHLELGFFRQRHFVWKPQELIITDPQCRVSSGWRKFEGGLGRKTVTAVVCLLLHT